MKTFNVLTISFFFSLMGYTQYQDSLVSNLTYNIEQATTDSARIGYKIELIKQVYKSDVDTTRIIINDVLKVLEDKSENYYQSCKATALNYLGILDTKESKTEQALTTYLKALDISQNLKDSINLGLTFHNLGMFYKRQKEFDKAKQYLKKAITIKEQLHNIENLALSHHMLAITYYENKQQDSLMYHLDIVKNLPCSGLRKSKANGSLAAFYYSNKAYDKAIHIYKENIGISKKAQDINAVSYTHLTLPTTSRV